MSQHNPPRISVLMPVYNAEKYLKEAIDSVLNQTYDDFELLIINDGSKDASKEIIFQYADTRIRYIENSENKGLIYTLNVGIDAARGMYIARMDADDVSLPQRFEKQVSYLEENKACVILGTSCELIDEKGECVGVEETGLPPHHLAAHLFFNNFIVHTSVMGVTEIFRIYKYSPDYYLAEDYHLWSVIGQHHQIANLPDKLIQYRVHAGSISKQKAEQQERCVKKIYSLHLSSLCGEGLGTEQIELHYRILRCNIAMEALTWKQTVEILTWLSFLEKQNAKKHIYDNEYFRKKMAGFWHMYLLHSCTFGLVSLLGQVYCIKSALPVRTRLSLIVRSIANVFS